MSKCVIVGIHSHVSNYINFTSYFAARLHPAMLHTTKSNPLVTCAVVSRHIAKVEADLPVLRKGLRRLHREIDALATEVRCDLFAAGKRCSRFLLYKHHFFSVAE